MGKSRSVTLAIAYLLFTLPRSAVNTPSYILGLIRQTRPFAEPNPGFMSQLELYHTMNMPATLADLDVHPEYQRWLYHRAVEESNSRGVAPEVGEIRFADKDPVPLFSPQQASSATAAAAATAAVANTLSPSSSPTGTSTDSTPPRDQTSGEPQAGQAAAAKEPAIINYRCRRCRYQLATSSYVVEHSAGDAITFPRSTRRGSNYKNNNDSTTSKSTALTTSDRNTSSNPCNHIFVEPLSWMRPELEQGKVEGRFECPNPKCEMIVGRYAWQGLKCSCGAWVMPGVSLARGKVDEVREAPVTGAGAGGLRKPPPLGGREEKI